MRALSLLCCSTLLLAQAPPPKDGPIQDNSFLVEEAYNQEDRVVQHINTWQQDRKTKEWVATFTQEWPAGGLKHQLSFTLPAQRLLVDPVANQFRTAAGDVAINYRYQWIGDGEARVAVSPRISLYLPTGDEKLGMGRGANAYELQLPVSAVLAEKLVSHTNLNVILAPGAKDATGAKADTTGWGAGQSLIWLTHPRFNVMLEWAYRDDQVVAGPNQTLRQKGSFLNPGIRWAHDFPSGLQIVPGIAVPIGVGPSRGEKGIFFYISFEHPFGRRP